MGRSVLLTSQPTSGHASGWIGSGVEASICCSYSWPTSQWATCSLAGPAVGRLGTAECAGPNPDAAAGDGFGLN